MAQHHAHHSPDKSALSARYLTPARLVTLTTVVLSLAVIVHLIYQWWPHLLMISIQWQRSSVEQISDLIYSATQDPSAMWSLVEISFLYGIFHSIGPGHGKLIVSSYLATNPAKINTALWITVISALVQALVAIAIVSVFLFVMHLTMHHVNQFVEQIFNVSYLGVLLIGAVIFYQGARYFWQRLAQRKQHGEHSHKHEQHHSHSHSSQAHHHQHSNDGTCSCGHKHSASPQELNHASTLKEYAAIIASIGIRPCTGAILVLLFANLANVYWLGVASAILMAVGTAFTTSTIALLTVSGRKVVQHYLTANSQSSFPWVWPLVRIFCGLALIIVSYLLAHQSGFGVSPVFNVR
ncbi:nickel/cobalt transporter [Vibrio tritonius]|uniref:nickel/cobalt transporter n=1 Tax=Vibrio tritonius TaxID=1435069 RepID=UPI0008395F10|nr:hypothetical protein [Vibrio tritonius]